MDRITRRHWLTAGAASLAAPALVRAAGRPADGVYAFHHDHVIGTSLDLHVAAADGAAADAAEHVVLGEVERLRRVLSVYDPASELSHVNRSRGPVAVSADLAAVLRAYEVWDRATGGAVSGQLGELVRAWADAAAAGDAPADDVLDRLARDLRSPGWRLDPAAGTVERLGARPLNLNALGKAYVVDRAAAAVRDRVPGVSGLLLDVGGDVAAWGGPPGGAGWAVGVPDPAWHFDNAAPLAGLRLANRAAAGSGGYQRFVTVGGVRHSHVLDPRTGRPAAGVAGATAVAPDAVTANALATALCVLSPADGLRLLANVPGADGLIVAADGTRFRSPGLELFDVAPARVVRADAADEKAGGWPAGFQVTVAVELPKVEAKRYRRPYAAVWVEDDKGKAVRTLAVWGTPPKYLKDLNDWWKIGKADADLVKAVARATRGPGRYDLVWDGKDDKGKAVPPGTYTVRVEVHREFGAHVRQAGKIECRDKPAAVKLEKNAEAAETAVEFKKVEKK